VTNQFPLLESVNKPAKCAAPFQNIPDEKKTQRICLHSKGSATRNQANQQKESAMREVISVNGGYA
jgi:hypothetical protein